MRVLHFLLSLLWRELVTTLYFSLLILLVFFLDLSLFFGKHFIEPLSVAIIVERLLTKRLTPLPLQIKKKNNASLGFLVGLLQRLVEKIEVIWWAVFRKEEKTLKNQEPLKGASSYILSHFFSSMNPHIAWDVTQGAMFITKQGALFVPWTLNPTAAPNKKKNASLGLLVGLLQHLEEKIYQRRGSLMGSF